MLYAQVARKNGAILRWPLRGEQLGDLLNVTLPKDQASLEAMDLSDYNIYPVPGAELPPSSGPGKKFQLAEPVWDGGKLVRQFNEVDRTPEELATAIRDMRKRRNGLLRNSDWSQMVGDITPELKQAFVDYRQALRDLPSNTKDPFNIQWPESPDDAEG